MDYILSGDPQAVKHVLQENRLRVDRGLIKFTPYQPETAIEDSKEPNAIEDSKEPSNMIDEKAPKTKRSKKSE